MRIVPSLLNLQLMCGFIGIFGPEGSHGAGELYEGLLAVQHRGQDAAGITTFTDAFHVKKGSRV